jgi:riboflavin kinase/FMN adenylyltransferase
VSLITVHDWQGLKPQFRGASVALGNFDGLHQGHQRVVATAVDAARKLGVPAGVISFDPHPRRWFQPDAEPFRVMGPGQLARALEQLGVEILYLLPFGAEMAAMSDEAFARDVMAGGMGVKHVAAGFDVTFGKDRAGSDEKLRQYGARFGFGVTIVERMATLEGVKYSSTEARRAVAEGRPEAVVAILGRPFAIEGVVVQGDQIGRTLGFPTANVSLSDYIRPAFGVYAVRVRLADGRVIKGVANIGHRPTIAGGREARLEAHLFDFAEDLYGQTIETELVAYLRPEQKFDGLDALKARIAKDEQEARRRLAQED